MKPEARKKGGRTENGGSKGEKKRAKRLMEKIANKSNANRQSVFLFFSIDVLKMFVGFPSSIIRNFCTLRAIVMKIHHLT